jgi:betaine-homocysteine S-methyltransferase
MTASLAERLRAGTVLGAEGYVFELERRGYIKAGPFVPEVVLDFPDAVRELHREFLRAGAEVMVALTYYAHREKLRDVGREGDLEAMNRQAVRIARQVAREGPANGRANGGADNGAGGEALVAGNVCNTWAYDPEDPASRDTVRAMYAEQLGWAAEEGVDAIAPTMETLCSPDGKERAFPLALDPFTCTRFDMAQFALRARELGVDYIGICCGAGPHHVRAMAEALGREVPASRYSPSMELHPMFRPEVSAKDAAFLHSWNA